MAAEVQLARDKDTAASPEAKSSHHDPGNFAAEVTHAKGDPAALATLLKQTGRANDPATWTWLQQTIGNQQTLEVRAAMAPRAAATDTLPAQVERDVMGVAITAPAGVHAAALDECTRIVTQEVGKNAYAQDHFKKSKVSIVIVPAAEKMTDVPEFQHLRGQKTFDGRDWATVRGSGGTPTPSGKFAIAVAEENATTVPGVKSAYPATYSIAMHELAHVLESHGMTPQQQARVKQLYAQHTAAKASFTDSYGAENEKEYFAQSTNAFFGRNTIPGYNNGRAWLQTNDPDMYAFCVDLYDKAEDKHGHVAA